MRKLITGVATAVMAVSVSMTSLAGNWQQNSTGWWYQNDDGTWPANTWQWIDGKCYYFDGNGYMLANEQTPDGYSVDENGAWTVGGVVQIQQDVPAESHGSDPYDNDLNRAALAAYTYDLKNNSEYELYYDSKHGGRSLTMDPHFIVLDVNADGVYEVFLYSGGPSMAPHWLLYYDHGVVQKKEWHGMPTIGLLENGEFYVSGGNHGWFWGERYTLTGSTLNLLERLEYDVSNAGFLAVQNQIGQYTDRMVQYNFVYLSDENLNRYLGGNGESTGVK